MNELKTWYILRILLDIIEKMLDKLEGIEMETELQI